MMRSVSEINVAGLSRMRLGPGSKSVRKMSIYGGSSIVFKQGLPLTSFFKQPTHLERNTIKCVAVLISTVVKYDLMCLPHRIDQLN